MESPIVSVDQLTWTSDDAQAFDQLVVEYQVFKINEDLAKRCREDCGKRIEAMLLLLPEPVRVQSGTCVVQRVTSKSADKLEPKRLLELGVSAATIQAATVEGKSYSYVMVKAMKEAK